MDAALILARLGQYLGAAGLFGSALFLARQPNAAGERAERGLVVGSALVLIAATLLALVLQSATMAGQADPSMVAMVMTGTTFGYAVAVRLVACAGALAAFVVLRDRTRPWVATALGAVATASLAWGGHGVADEGAAGAVHLVADIVHLLAAALWIGALGALGAMLVAKNAALDRAAGQRLYMALKGFSGAGTLAVALLVLTGLVNSWFLVGPTHLGALLTTLYGRLLLVKLLLLTGMLTLAAANRWRHTPRLAIALGRGNASSALPGLLQSVALETAAAGAVLVLVAWLGTLAPPMSN